LRVSQKRDFTPEMLAKALNRCEFDCCSAFFWRRCHAKKTNSVFRGRGSTDESDLNLQKNIKWLMRLFADGVLNIRNVVVSMPHGETPGRVGRGRVSIKHILPVSTPSRMVFFTMLLTLPCFCVLMPSFDLIFRVVAPTVRHRASEHVRRVERSFLQSQTMGQYNNQGSKVSIPRRVKGLFLLMHMHLRFKIFPRYQYPEGSRARFHSPAMLRARGLGVR